jgi:1,2-diacylglycerol 3-beta-galactosyltransferase
MTEALNVLNHFGSPLQIVALAGGDEAEFRKLKAMDWHQTAHVFNFVENMPELMKASDVILCKAGGLITSEALACGLPMVLVDVIPGQETGNANYVIQHKAGEMAEDPLKVLEVFSHWMKDDQAGLKKATRNAVRLGKPLAAYHAANVIWKQLNIKCDPLPKKDEVIERLHHVDSLKSTIQRIRQLGQ